MNDSVFLTVAEALDKLELHYRKEENVFHLVMNEEAADFTFLLVADDENEALTVVGYLPVKVPQDQIDRMCRVINDLNYKYPFGALVIDPEDGELSYRMANNVDDGAVNVKIVQTCFLQVLARLKYSYGEIMRSLFGGPQVTFRLPGGDDTTPSSLS